MTDSDPDEEGSGEVSCQQQQNSEGDEDVEEVEASGSRASAKPILSLTERNEEDTGWTRDGTKTSSGRNKLTSEDMTRVRKHKELMRTEVTKNELVDRWLRDHIKPERWDRIVTVFPNRGKYSSQQK